MKVLNIVAIVLLLAGAAVLGYNRFTYTTNEEVLKIGPITANAERTHTVSFPPMLGWLLLGGGVCVLAFAAISRKN